MGTGEQQGHQSLTLTLKPRPNPNTNPSCYHVGIDLKELGGHMSKCLKFCTGIKILNRFSFKNERL